MIRFRDSLTLSVTKLRTRKVRLIVTVVISGLLFCGLSTASLVARGVFRSIDSFNKEGFGERYIVQGYFGQSYPDTTNAALIDKALAINKDTIARKKAAAKSLGIEYDSANEPTPVVEYDTPNGKERNLDFNHPAAKEVLRQNNASTPVGSDKLEEAAKAYNVKDTYESIVFVPAQDGGSVQVLKNGKENFEQLDNKFMNVPPTGTDSFTSFWTLMSSELMQPFVLKGADLKDKGDATIPIIVPISAAEQLLGLKSLPASAKPAERLDRMKYLRDKSSTINFQICYRNSTSANLINSAVSTAQEIERNKKVKDYVKPELIYGLPTQPCGAAVVTRDVRDADEKRLAVKQEQFDVMFGKTPAEQQTLAFRVVGLSPDLDTGAAFGASQIISSLVTSSLGTGWYTPIEFKTKAPLLEKLFATDTTGMMSVPTYFAEFPTAASARSFIDEKNCAPDYSMMQEGKNVDPFIKCREEGKEFSLNPYGSNSLALDSAKRTFSKVFGVVALVAAAIAAVIMMGTVGRMIADSRRETAVFRAIGAKKIDIAQVYILYTVLLALLICGFAIVIGMIAASYVNHTYSPAATVQALVAYNAQDLDKDFLLFYFSITDMAKLVGLIISASIVSSFLPLIRNLRRNPIRDMRDDT